MPNKIVKKKTLGPSERRFTVQYKKALKRHLLPSSDASIRIRHLVALAEECWQEDDIQHTDRQTRSHHWAACMVLATDIVLMEEVTDVSERLDLMRKVLLEPNSKTIRFFTRAMLFFSSDAFRSLAKYSERNIPARYGGAFEIETLEHSQQTYVQAVTQCFYNDYFRAADRPYLTKLFCAFDQVWIDVIEPGRDRVRFRRPETLESGGTMCRFEFRRIE